MMILHSNLFDLSCLWSGTDEVDPMVLESIILLISPIKLMNKSTFKDIFHSLQS